MTFESLTREFARDAIVTRTCCIAQRLNPRERQIGRLGNVDAHRDRHRSALTVEVEPDPIKPAGGPNRVFKSAGVSERNEL